MSRSSSRSSTIHGVDSSGSAFDPDDRQKSLAAKEGNNEKTYRADGKIELTEDDNEEILGYAYPAWKKWMILVTILLIQTSMNSNAAMYGSGVEGISEKYGISTSTARLGQALFLIAYGFGCELWAPWSEEIGRWPTQQASLFLVNIWQISSALSPTWGGVLASRILGGLSTSGGSVTLGVIADLYHPEDTGFQYAVAFVILSSVGGAPIGTVIGGFVAYLHEDPAWIFWTLLIMGGIVQAVHFFLVPETRSTIILDREARNRRKNGEQVWGPNELKEKRFSAKEVGKIWWRPFEMFLTEPIVLWLSLLSGFSDSLIFTFMEAFTPIFKQYNFNTWQIGLTFLSSIIGYIISYFTFLPVIWHHNQTRKRNPDKLSPESRLWWLLFLAPLLVVGLFGFAFTSFGPPIPWIVPLLFTGIIAIANYAVYKSSIDYMTASYGIFAASATGGNDLARDFLAGVAALYAHPFYEHWSKSNERWHLIYPTVILGCLAVPIILPIYVFYYKGPKLRLKSKFAMELEKARLARLDGKHRRSTIGASKKEASELEKV